jgi:hypothetical protein
MDLVKRGTHIGLEVFGSLSYAHGMHWTFGMINMLLSEGFGMLLPNAPFEHGGHWLLRYSPHRLVLTTLVLNQLGWSITWQQFAQVVFVRTVATGCQDLLGPVPNIGAIPAEKQRVTLQAEGLGAVLGAVACYSFPRFVGKMQE